MKALISIYLSLFICTLQAQNTSFTKVFSKESNSIIPSMIELSNKDLLAIVTGYSPNSTIKFESKIYIIATDGKVKDSITFNHVNRSLQVRQIIPTPYGYCLLGQMNENNQTYFWVAKLGQQFNIISQHFEELNQSVGSLLISNYALTKNKEIIVVIMENYPRYFQTTVAKITDSCTLSCYKTLPSLTTIPINISSRNDSLGYLLLGNEVIVTDTAFNVKHKKNLGITDQNIAFLDLQPTFLRTNDTTFLVAGRWTNYNGRRTRDLVFLKIGLKGDTKFFKTIESIRDTNYCQAITRSIDTTKDGRFIYWGGKSNHDYLNPWFSLNQSPFVLTKLDAQYATVWQKNYISNTYNLMQGVLATSDGGCVMYGVRYDYNNIPKLDAIIIKVDGNGVVTSETTIPITQTSVTAYPNPSTGQLNFKKETPSVFERFDVSIFDISGKLVFEKKETDLSEMIDLTHLAEGNYMYQIQQQGVVKNIGKWVKVK